MNFLGLCQDLVSEVGIAGGTGPATTAEQVGELKNVVRWVQQSSLYIDNLWRDWKYLWQEYDVTVSSSVVLPPIPAVREWNRASVWINYGTGAAQQLTYKPWDQFRVENAGGASLGTPTEFSIKPNNSMVLNRSPASPVPLHAEYWKRPESLQLNDDIPDLPEEYHRLIVCRAAIMYGNREAAGEIISGMEAEYTDLLEKVQSAELEPFRNERMAGQDLPLQMEPQ